MLRSKTTCWGCVAAVLALTLWVGCGQTPEDNGNDPDTTDNGSDTENGGYKGPIKNGDGGKVVDNSGNSGSEGDGNEGDGGEVDLPPKNTSPDPDQPSKYAELSTADLIKELGDETSRTLIAPELAARSTEAVPLLMLELNSDDEPRQAAAAFVLGTFGEAAKPTLAKLKEIAKGDGQAAIAASYAVDAIEPKDEPKDKE